MRIYLRLKRLIARLFKRLLRLRLFLRHDFQMVQHRIEAFGNLVQLIPMMRRKPQRALAVFDFAHNAGDALYAIAHGAVEHAGKKREDQHQRGGFDNQEGKDFPVIFAQLDFVRKKRYGDSVFADVGGKIEIAADHP